MSKSIFDKVLIRKMLEEEHINIEDIAKELNCDLKKLKRFCQTQKISYSKYIDINDIKNRLENGEALTHIAKEYKSNHRTLKKLCEENNIDPNYKQKTYDPNEIRRLIDEGKSIPQLSNYYHCTDVTLYKFCQENNIEYRQDIKWKERKNITTEKVKELIESGYMMSDILKYYKCGKKRLYRFCKENNIELPELKYNRLNYEEIKSFIENNKSIAYISRYYNCTPINIKKFCEKNNIEIKRHTVRDRFDIDEIKRMISEGYVNSEIATYYKCNINTLSTFCRDNEIEWNKIGFGKTGPKTGRNRRFKLELKKDIIEKMILEGDSLMKIMVDHGYSSLSTIKNFCKNNSIAYNYITKMNNSNNNLNFTIEKIKYLIEYGLSFKNISLYYNCDKKLLREFCDKNEILFDKY